MVTALLLYIIGKNKNSCFAWAWFNTHSSWPQAQASCTRRRSISIAWGILLSALWGDAYPAQVPRETELTESPGPDVRSVSDQVQLKVTMNDEDMDIYVFAAGTWRAMVRLQKEMQEWVL